MFSLSSTVLVKNLHYSYFRSDNLRVSLYASLWERKKGKKMFIVWFLKITNYKYDNFSSFHVSVFGNPFQVEIVVRKEKKMVKNPYFESSCCYKKKLNSVVMQYCMFLDFI